MAGLRKGDLVVDMQSHDCTSSSPDNVVAWPECRRPRHSAAGYIALLVSEPLTTPTACAPTGVCDDHTLRRVKRHAVATMPLTLKCADATVLAGKQGASSATGLGRFILMYRNGLVAEHSGHLYHQGHRGDRYN